MSAGLFDLPPVVLLHWKNLSLEHIEDVSTLPARRTDTPARFWQMIATWHLIG
jgi:hypothetical protein